VIFFSRVIKTSIYITRFEKITTAGQIMSYVVSLVGRNLSIGVIPDSRLRKVTDADLIKEAFDKRFKEIERQKMRQLVPGLLPEDQRLPFTDPEWDNRNDPVPAWLIAVHVLSMNPF
jgi:hypothetical protein